MRIKSFAKINLTLDILGVDEETGYHFVDTIILEVPNLADNIDIKKRKDQKIVISCSDSSVPTDEKNTCYQAANILSELSEESCGLDIFIEKNIPTQSGLGGGSSNGAAVLKFLNELWNINLPDAKLAEISSDIGIDVPFFIYGGCAYCTHYGEKIYPIPKPKNIKIELINTNLKMASSKAYEDVDYTKTGINHTKTIALKDKLIAGEEFEIGEYTHNDFEQLYKESTLKKHKQAALKKGAKSAQITGSGATIFAIY